MLLWINSWLLVINECSGLHWLVRKVGNVWFSSISRSWRYRRIWKRSFVWWRLDFWDRDALIQYPRDRLLLSLESFNPWWKLTKRRNLEEYAEYDFFRRSYFLMKILYIHSYGHRKDTKLNSSVVVLLYLGNCLISFLSSPALCVERLGQKLVFKFDGTLIYFLILFR